MICDHCGHEWELRHAHIISAELTAKGFRELVQCPKCGRVQTVSKPDVGACDDAD